ncbi:tripartite motif-containing protein 2-like [Gigantopelta aegis]|uniref:tripartite motif-containing protein 2-like n=1 Tax=Gigantopelta aegis TaxID=1735272 RepID=UPI001B887B95|nr:tripartite motif-containing protein 2-like [Gigantopelta aegis]XP_041360362.1 tripartite motif-containing protein 2-like [Gigantopelta aegis]XP_041360364.1 tripartite motif-containing protein 2-like [Gigantopelta aegis]XP_041360365.1 tripartite motif-containing protein 2-like [Gigantopelta aegis]XP_041360366.1 tripartite motif-containing protein 2-like [Gigantopelta aegis]
MAGHHLPMVRQIDRELLSCGICLERYKVPKVLPCLHTFCQKCLNNYIPPESLSLTCPICRQQSIVPLQGVIALQTNFFITNLMDVLSQPSCCMMCDKEENKPVSKCLDCEEYLCEGCVLTHSNMDSDKLHTVVSLDALSGKASSDEPQLVCPNHDGNALQYYCVECETAVCKNCTAVEHIGHRMISLKEAIHEHKSGLQTLISEARSQIPNIEHSISIVTDVSDSLENKSRMAKDRIGIVFQELMQILDSRKSALIIELNSIYSSKQQTLLEQRETLESILSRINSCCDFTQETLENGNEMEILLVKKEMCEKLQELAGVKIQFQPEENEYLTFDESCFHELSPALQNVGAIQTNSAVAFETTATGEGLKHCYIGRPAVVTVTTKDRRGELIKFGCASLTAEITSQDLEQVILPTVTDHRNGTYDLTYTLRRPGIHQLEIKLFNQHIRGSPFKIKSIPGGEEVDQFGSSSRIPRTNAVKQKGTKRPSSSRSHGSNRRSNPIEDDLIVRIGVKGRNKGEFTNPQGVCCVNGKILAADSNNQTVQVFSNDGIGECRLKFGSPGRVPGKMQRPTGIAVTVNGNYLIADYDNKWISVFSPDGKYINKFGTGKLLGPKGLAVDNNGHIIVVDNKASTVFIFQSNGKVLHKFGSRGNDNGQFAGPHYVAINSSNDIIISDFHNHCVKVFDCEGSFLFSFGSNGEGNGQFNAPTGVAVDKNDNVLVADWGNSRIQVFDSCGSFLSYVNTTADPLYGPQGLSITKDGQVVVADSGNHCIKVYKYLQ